MVFTNVVPDTLNLFFPNNDVFAVAADLGSISSSTLDISFFGLGDALLGTTTALANNAGTGFFGVSSDNSSQPITRINLSSQTGQHPGVPNIAFGGEAAAVPEPATLLLLASGLFGLGLMRWRKAA
jgi:hypothetical protein